MRLELQISRTTVTSIPADGIPLATTCSVLAPDLTAPGTSKKVKTRVDPVATPIVLWSCVRGAKHVPAGQICNTHERVVGGVLDFVAKALA